MLFLSGLGIKVMLAFQNELQIVPSSSIFGKGLSIGVNHSLYIWQSSPVSPSSSELSLMEVFDY